MSEQGTDTTTTPQEPAVFGEDGRFLGGRMDVEGFNSFTQEDLQRDPRLAKLAKSYAHLETEYNGIKNGKVIIKDSVPEEFWGNVEFDDAGKIVKDQRKVLLDGGIPEQAIELFETARAQTVQLRQSQFDTWVNQKAEKSGVDWEQVSQFVEKSGFYTDEQQAKWKNALQDPDLREIAADRIIADFKENGSGNFRREPGAKNRIPDGTALDSDDLSTYPGDYEEARKAYRADYMRADRPEELDAKWKRTLKRLGQA